MRSFLALVAALLAVALPSPALAGTFVVPFGYGTPMTAAGWIVWPHAGAICGYEGVGTLWLNAGTLPAHTGCFYLFNAPGLGQIVAVNASHGFVKASTATAMCAYSVAAVGGDTLRHCSGGSFVDAIATSGPIGSSSASTTRAISPSPSPPRAPTTPSTPGGGSRSRTSRRPSCGPTSPTRVQSGLAATLEWSVSDAESGAPALSYSIDGGARVGIRGQACSWLCGTLASGSVPLDLGALADGPHSVTVHAKSYADAESTYGPFSFRVDRTAPAQPLVHVVPDAAAATAGWWDATVALSVSSATAPDVAGSILRVYGPSGAVVHEQSFAGALTAASIPAAALTGGGVYELDVIQCDITRHCATSSRAALRWDGSPPPAPADTTAPPLGLLAARDGAHMTWPALGASGWSGIAGAFTGIGPTPAAARAQALAAAEWQAGVPGTSDTAISATAVRGAGQVCLAVRPVSGAGLASASAGVRCALVDEQPPEVTVSGAQRWSGGAQTVGLAVTDANGATFAQVLLDGVPVKPAVAAITVAGEGSHVLRAVARDGAGNETIVERALGVDATPPVIGNVTADFVAREVRVGVTDALAGVSLAEVRLGGTGLETRISADGLTAIARVPAGLALDGAPVVVRVQDASSPANARETAATLPERTRPVLRGLTAGRGRVSGRVIADAATRVRVWAYPKGRVAYLVGAYPTDAGGRFAVSVRPGRTTRYAVAVPESQELRSATERVAGTVRVTARISALAVRVRGDRLAVRARFPGRRGSALTSWCTTCAAVAGLRPVSSTAGPAYASSGRAACGAPAGSRRAPAAAPGPTAWSSPPRPARGRGARRRANPSAPSSRSERGCGPGRPRATPRCRSRSARPVPGGRMSTGLFALWVGWPGGLALYACGRAARVMRRDELLVLATRAPGTRSTGRS